MPYNATAECDSGDYHMTLDRCLAAFDWAGRSGLQGKLVEGRHHGIAASCYIEGGASGPMENARLELHPDGTVTVFVGSSAIGQGIETIFAQIAADALEVPMERIRRVCHGSTTHVTEGFGSYASRAAVMGGSAILDAAANLKDALARAAAAHFGCDAEAVSVRELAVHGPAGEAAPLTLIVPEGVAALGSFASRKRTYSYGAHAAHVAVDPHTGAVELIAYVAVEDVGRIINPATLNAQVVGAIVQGLGGALLERLVYDADGQLVTASFGDYAMPLAADFRNITAIALERFPSPNNPLGAKGAGEGGIIPVGGVIANAVASALATYGVEPRELPLSPPRVWQLIEEAKARQVRRGVV
jgi:carbon-monoxide dehydrogenase large subunit